MQTKLQEIKEELRRRMHWPIPQQREWLEAGRDRTLCILCCPNEQPGALGVPALCDRHLEARASATQPKRRLHLGPHRADIRTLAPKASHPSPLARCALRHETPEVGDRCPKSGSPGYLRGASGNGHPCPGSGNSAADTVLFAFLRCDELHIVGLINGLTATRGEAARELGVLKRLQAWCAIED